MAEALHFPSRIRLPDYGNLEGRVEDTRAPIKPSIQNRIVSDMINTLRETLATHATSKNERGINHRVRIWIESRGNAEWLVVILDMDAVESAEALRWTNENFEPVSFFEGISRAMRLCFQAGVANEYGFMYRVSAADGLKKYRRE